MIVDPKRFGANVKAFRKELSITRSELSDSIPEESLQVSAKEIKAIESGDREVTLNEYLAICKALFGKPISLAMITESLFTNDNI